MADRRPRVGLIGCGRIGSAVHLRVLARSTRAELACVADPDPAARERAQRIARVPVVAEAGELLGRGDLDAVVICATSAAHAALALAAVEAGKHVYVEKPIATTLADGERVRDAVQAAGVVAAVGFNRRRHPLFRAARDAVEDGLLGDVVAVQTIFSEPAASVGPAWRSDPAAGGGPVADLGSHHFDLARWLLGERGVLHVDRHAPPARLEAARPDEAAVARRRLRGGSGGAAWRLRRLARPGDDPSYRLTLGAFLERVAGAERELPTVEDGLRSLEAVLAAERERAGER